MGYKRCPICRHKLHIVDEVDGIGDIYQCNDCGEIFYVDDGELSAYEPLSYGDAMDIYESNGMDEDYSFF